MAQLPDEVKKAISKQEIFPVATCNQDRSPNVVYIKYLKVIDDQTVLIADNFLNKTRDNILSNGNIAFVVRDEEKGSFQIKGTAEILTEGDMFDEVQKWVPDKLPRVAAVVMHIEEIYNGAILMNPDIRITTLVENTASDPKLLAEHGLSFWIEYGDKKILFDTGQSNILIQNAKTLGINLSEADAIILSHGHYDHTGGLAAVLDIAAKAKIYLHPAAIEPKFSRKASGAESIGMPEDAKKVIRDREVIWTETPTQIFPGVIVTGQVPRINNFEDVGGAFFLDESCRKPDELLDDQTLFIETAKGLVIIFGCAHAGVVNTLHLIADLSGKKQFYAVLGGMHLLRASEERIERTETVFRQYNLQRIGPAHCTGGKAVEKFKSAFPDRYFTCSVGTRIVL